MKYKLIFISFVVGLILSATSAQAFSALDLIFVIDLTGSMSDDIEEVQDQASEIVDYIAENIPNYRIAIVGYRDFGEQVMFEDYSFSDDKEEILDNIDALSVYGGGDWREAVYEGLMRAINTEEIGSWRDGVAKKIILMGDAPPHEKEDGPNYIYDIDDVAQAAYEVDPANIYSIAIEGGNGSESANEAFAELAEKTNGKFLTVSDAEDVPAAIMEILEDIDKEIGGMSWWVIVLIIVGIGFVLAVIILVLVLKKK